MGDEHVFSGKSQFTSTMKFEYGVHVPSKELAVMKPAGKPLGVSTSTREVNIKLGDTNKAQPERLLSVTSQEYVTPELYTGSLHQHSHLETTVLASKNRLTKWNTKNELLMSTAHAGLKTREDVPHDNSKFCCFTTTNNEAFPVSSNKEAAFPIIRYDKLPRGKTSIPLGDPGHREAYNTTSMSAYVPHSASSAPKQSRNIANRESFIFKFGSASQTQEAYLTTNNRAYTTVDSVQMEKERASLASILESMVEKERGKGNIAFGDQHYMDNAPPNLNYSGCQSVTMMDFKPIDTRRERPRKANIQDGILLALYPERNLQSQTKPDTLQSMAATAPSTPFSNSSEDSMRPEHFRKHKVPEKVEPPSKLLHFNDPTIAQNQRYMSSVPTGDSEKYALDHCETTTNSAYKAYLDAEMPTFPKGGERITKTNFTIGDGSTDSMASLSSTSAAAFVAPENFEKTKKLRPRSHMSYSINGEYPMAGNNTTHTTMYQDRTKFADVHKLAKAPPCVPSTLMFPTRANPDPIKSYQTTTGTFFGGRRGLWDVEIPNSDLAEKRKAASESHITIGDKTHFTTLGDPIFT
jgi:hypothetical protein